MSRYAKRKDTNQNEIVDVLEQAGCNVTDLSAIGTGISDVLCTRAGIHYLIEIKSRRGKLTDAQVTFHTKHKPVFIARTVNDALRIVGLMK